MEKKDVIIIPARYGSKRLPGKPLKLIGGESMIRRVYEIAWKAIEGMEGVEVVVATDDERIRLHVEGFGGKVVMTGESRTGSDRALEACGKLGYEPGIVVNLQGDTPLMPVGFVRETLKRMREDERLEVGTPVVQLSWEELDKLRESKRVTPFTGTTVIVGRNGDAIWFSKNIIPGIREEEKIRERDGLSPVFQHVGLYGYRYEALKKFVSLGEGYYEGLEGLEQLRMLENGMRIGVVKMEYEEGSSTRGVDSIEDIERAEKFLLHSGCLKN